jgi:hypothetical protein
VTELEVITTAVGCFAVLSALICAAAASRGWVEGSVTLKVIPPWKRGAPEPKVPKLEPERAPEGDVAGLEAAG